MKPKKMKINWKTLALAGLTGFTLITSGCSSNMDKTVEKPKIEQTLFNEDNYFKTRIIEGKEKRCYRSDYIMYSINKDKEVTNEFIYDTGLLGFGGVIYELRTEDLIVYGDGMGYTKGEDYLKQMLDGYLVYKLIDLPDYIECDEIKKWLTLEEVEAYGQLTAEISNVMYKEKSEKSR